MEIKKLLKEINGKELKRSLVINADSINEAERTVSISVSSDAVIEHWFGNLILDHNEKSIDLTRFKDGASFRDTHWGDQIGIISSAWVEKGKLYVKVKFSNATQRAKEIFQDIVDGIRRNVSIQFDVKEMSLEKEEKGKPPIYRATKWEPIHASMEADGADASVGVGRAKTINENSIINQTRSYKMNEEEKKLAEERAQLEKEHNQALAAARKKGGEDRANEVASIYSMARMMQPNVPQIDLIKEADKYVRESKNYNDFLGFVEGKMDLPETIEARAKASPYYVDAPKNEVKREYSISAFLGSLMPNAPKSVVERAGYAQEISKEISKKLGRNPQGGFIPMDYLTLKGEERDMKATSDGYGEQLVGTDHLAGSFIELLRNKMLVKKLGAKTLSGLVGNISIPKWASGSTFGWVATEAAGGSESTPGTSAVTMSPKEASTYVDISRQLLLQGTPDADFLVKDDLTTIMALGIDHGAINAAGGTGEPTGILNTSGIGSVTLTDFDWDAALEFESKVDVANALEGNLAFITTPTVRAALKGRLKKDGVAQGFLCEKNMMNDYLVYSTNQMAANKILFGNFSQLIIGEWGGLDIHFYQAPITGIVTFTVFRSLDYAVRQPGAFAAGENFS